MGKVEYITNWILTFYLTLALYGAYISNDPMAVCEILAWGFMFSYFDRVIQMEKLSCLNS